MSKILKRFKEGEPIPDGAKFIEKVEVRDKTPHRFSYQTRPYALFWEHETMYAHYHVRAYYVYEVKEGA